MSPEGATTFWSRRPEVSGCLEGDNAVLFQADLGREKTINHTGLAVWRAMDGTASADDLACRVAREYGLVVHDDLRRDVQAFAGELLNDGFVSVSPQVAERPMSEERYSRIEEAPRHFDLSLTGACNLACEYCFYADEMTGRRDLPAGRWLSFFEELKSLGVRNAALSGGELFMRRDLWELLEGAVDARLRLSLLTNGTLLTRATVERLAVPALRRRLDSIQVSIDGSCAAVHDASRGAGSFEKALHGLRMLKEAGLPATARVTVNAHNAGDLDNTARLLLDDVGLARIGTNDAMPMGTGCAHRGTIGLSPPQRVEAMRSLVGLEREYPGRITAQAGSLALWHMFREMEEARASGEKTRRWKMGFLSSCGCMFAKLAVHHDGMIVPCNMLAAATLGPIGETPIRAVWRDHPLLAEMRGRGRIPMEQVPGCEGCEWAPVCSGGCPAVEYTRTGNLYRANADGCYRRFIEETGGRVPAV